MRLVEGFWEKSESPSPEEDVLIIARNGEEQKDGESGF